MKKIALTTQMMDLDKLPLVPRGNTWAHGLLEARTLKDLCFGLNSRTWLRQGPLEIQNFVPKKMDLVVVPRELSCVSHFLLSFHCCWRMQRQEVVAANVMFGDVRTLPPQNS